MRTATRLLLLALALAVAFGLALRLGAVPLGMQEIVAAARGRGDATSIAIVRELRLPRSVLAALVGGALAASGATFQALLRNPLAEPYVLGVSGGAAVGAVAAIVLGLGTSAWALPVSAFGGAVVAIVLVLRIALTVGRALDTRILLLAGVVVGAFFNACILLALTFADTESFRSAVFWMMGSFSGATWRQAGWLASYLVPGLLVLFALARPLDLIAIGEETAAHLGVRVEVTKYAAYAVASLLAAASVAAAGVIGFVGLVIPHAVRMLWGPGHRFLLPASVLLGAAFLVLTDALARSVAAPTELPVGVLTAFVGVPFFVWVMRSAGRRQPGAGTGVGDASRPAIGARGPRSPGAAAGPDGVAVSSPLVEVNGRSPAPLLAASTLTYRYPHARRPAAEGISLQLREGVCTAILGPNGSGKSTLLRLLLGSLPPDAGSVRLGGRPLRAWSPNDLARRVAVVQQQEEMAFPLPARELVAMGRYPYLGNWRREGPDDRRAIGQAMERCDVADLADRTVQTLSGGERQRVRLARALAQEPELLALDEPTVALDVRHEMAIFELLRELAAGGVTILIVTHNLNLAARYADELVLLDRGCVAAAGTPGQVLTRDLIERVYRWPVQVSPYPGPGPDIGSPQVTPLASPPAPVCNGPGGRDGGSHGFDPAAGPGAPAVSDFTRDQPVP